MKMMSASATNERRSHPLPTPNHSPQIGLHDESKTSSLPLPKPENPIQDEEASWAITACILPLPTSESEILSAPNLKSFSMDQLSRATSNFCEDSLLGEGGFGCVFKGWLDEKTLNASNPSSGLPVAIKRLIHSGFQGAARGLCFLHELQSPVIYRDFKASNVLLDSEFNAKLSDFGLAKTGPTQSQTHVTTRVMGTEGYCDPHYIATDAETNRRMLDRERPGIGGGDGEFEGGYGGIGERSRDVAHGR
ncbi:hypothetical protein SASPL_136277 [Salvia splendens]|uniref:Protein kinase domain-containing protein n=1 Tax=Salvia splendens TaxID=180675 RepID=A0A8X8X1U6_SALSN|nr:hypothetical protein SASPL_136277 [Salvia splendens]